MSVFQILDGQVIMIDGYKSYTDSVDNFKADSGLTDLPDRVVYDDSQKCCVVDDEFQTYPDEKFDGYLAKIGDFIAAKQKREYVPPADPTPEEEKQALTADYNEAVRELIDSFNIAVLRGDTEAQESIKQDFVDLQGAYKAEMEALK